jgi:hypothetical protein
MATLYELTDAYAQLMARLTDCESETEETEIIEALNDVDCAITDKGEAYARILRNLKADSDAYAAEIKRLKARKETADNAAERMLQHLHFAMEIAGATELRTSIGKFSIAKNPWSVVILDEADVPEEFLIPQPAKVDKTAILKHFKENGEIIDGCDVVQREGVRFR